MSWKSTILLAIAFGAGCSHAAPKPERSATALAAPPRPLAPARPQTDDRTAFESSPDDGAGNAIYFDFDSATIGAGARPTLQRIGAELSHSQKAIRIEGNCDERGTTEYNLALGDKRAWEAKRYLEHLGIPDRRISVVSYGSERPKAPGHDESAWAKNRRDDFKIR